jgi:hypothetical protein
MKVSPNTTSIEEVDVSDESNEDNILDIVNIGFDDNLRQEEEHLLQTLC